MAFPFGDMIHALAERPSPPLASPLGRGRPYEIEALQEMKRVKPRVVVLCCQDRSGTAGFEDHGAGFLEELRKRYGLEARAENIEVWVRKDE